MINGLEQCDDSNVAAGDGCNEMCQIETDPLAHWSFENNFLDSIGNGHDGTERGGVTFASGQVGQAGSFDGTNDYVETSSGMFNCNSNFTFNSWVNADVNNTIRTIISKRTAGSIQVWIILVFFRFLTQNFFII